MSDTGLSVDVELAGVVKARTPARRVSVEGRPLQTESGGLGVDTRRHAVGERGMLPQEPSERLAVEWHAP